MADDVVIRAEGLGKQYVIGHRAEREHLITLRDVLARGAGKLWRKATDLARGRAVVAGDTHEEFWALRDVSFEVKRGEVLGIIGRNGAGKTTLLKILSRITEPSRGRVTIKGRVASLLEVGTGFHPELTGRENIYLNGAILGMTRAEIRKKFDEIVAFAEVEKFLDTPVKRYSSGMYVRLAFAVAAHLEPEILVVDEVLAVGDAAFQKKCLNKMRAIGASEQRTILFVSHNLEALRRVCSHGLLLTDGSIAASGDIVNALSIYLSKTGGAGSQSWVRPAAGIAPPINLKAFRISAQSLTECGSLKYSEPLRFHLEIQNRTSDAVPAVAGVEIISADGISLLTSHSDDQGFQLRLSPGSNQVQCLLAPNPLMPGSYTVRIGIVDATWRLLDHVEPDISFEVSQMPYTLRALFLNRPGRIALPFEWDLDECETVRAL